MEEPPQTSRWQPVIDRMLEELRLGSPRAEAYWAQQLAFGPVFFNAVALAVRDQSLSPGDLELVRQLVPLAYSMLGPLPDGCDGDPAGFTLLAKRQANVLAWGRRHQVARLAERLGLDPSSLPSGEVPRRFQRPYPLIGWRPTDST